MLQHRYKGAINEHYVDKHGDKPTVETLLENTTIINRKSSKNLLYIAEAVAIEIRKPKLNVQKEFDYTLPSNRKPRRSTHGDTSHRPINAPGIDGGLEETAEETTTSSPTTETTNTQEEPADTPANLRRLRPLPHRRQ